MCYKPTFHQQDDEANLYYRTKLFQEKLDGSIIKLAIQQRGSGFKGWKGRLYLVGEPQTTEVKPII